jgi:hypothetical protein
MKQNVTPKRRQQSIYMAQELQNRINMKIISCLCHAPLTIQKFGFHLFYDKLFLYRDIIFANRWLWWRARSSKVYIVTVCVTVKKELRLFLIRREISTFDKTVVIPLFVLYLTASFLFLPLEHRWDRDWLDPGKHRTPSEFLIFKRIVFRCTPVASVPSVQFYRPSRKRMSFRQRIYHYCGTWPMLYHIKLLALRKEILPPSSGNTIPERW